MADKTAPIIPDKKLMDIVKPGKTPASANSRPVIIGHKPLKLDPMMAKDGPTKIKVDEAVIGDEPEPTGLKPVEAPVVKPVEPPKPEPKAEETKPGPEAVAETKAAPSKTEVAESPEEPAKEAPETGETTEETETPVDPKQAEKQAQQDKEEQAREAAVKKLIEDKKYFVQVGEVKRQRQARRLLLTILVLLVLAIVAADLLIDAGIVKTSIKPVLDLIHN